MANFLYDKARELYAFPNILADTIKVCLTIIGGGHYVVNQAADQFLSAIAVGDRYFISAALAGKSFTAGLFDATDLTLVAVAAGAACGALVIFHDTGVVATSELIGYIDGTGGTYVGLPVTPDGSNINIVWPNDANKIFKI